MYFFHVIFVILFLTSVLTLSTEKDNKIEQHKITDNVTLKSKENILNSTENHSELFLNGNVTEHKSHELKNSNSSESVLEGGGKVILTSSLDNLNKNASSTKNNSKESNQIEMRNVSARKSVSLPDRIKARKGVGNATVSSVTSLSSDNLNASVNNASINASIATEKSEKNSIPKVKTTLKESSENVTSVTKAPLMKNVTEKVKKHKLKPSVTIGGSNVDQPIPASPTKSPPLGMPRKMDYIVPIMITIFTVPVLSIATYVLYRRGRDCWDKRHYRRMDFLIDGMYNE